MSNNKLYTAEQVIQVFEKYGNMSAINARNIIDLSESIEIPSDEEIEKEAYENIIKQETWDSVEDKSTIFYGAFLMCAKYLRDKIQGGIK